MLKFVWFFQIKEEIVGCLDFLKVVYDVFGFIFKLYLFTRLEKYMGEIEIWNIVEKVKEVYICMCFLEIDIYIGELSLYVCWNILFKNFCLINL